MTIEDFKACVESGIFIDYDGYGDLALRTQYSIDFPTHKIKEITNWKLAPFFELPADELKIYYTKTRAEEIYRRAKPYDGAFEFLQELNKLCNIIFVTTQPNALVEKYTLDWLDIQNHRQFANGVFFTNEKDKADCDVYLDDAPHNIELLRKKGKRAIYFTQKWNEKEEGERVASYKEFIRLIVSINT